MCACTQVVAARINLPPAPAPTVHYRDSSGQLQQYDSSVARALLETMVGGRRSHLIVQDSRTGNELFFDLKTMRQREIAFIDNDSREIVFKDDGAVEFFVEVPWNPAALTAIAKTANQDMRRKVGHVLRVKQSSGILFCFLGRMDACISNCSECNSSHLVALPGCGLKPWLV